MLFKILKDKRLMAAIEAAEKQTKAPLLDILFVIFEHFTEVLALLNDPAALLAFIISLLNAKK
jgi:hypothetical protein